MGDSLPKGTIVVDLDGTICEHRYPAFGEPIAGAREALERLKAAGYRIVIYTVRTSSHYRKIGHYHPLINSHDAVRAYLNQHQIPFDEIWSHDKPVAVAYIDDRARCLEGNRKRSNWREIVDSLLP